MYKTKTNIALKTQRQQIAQLLGEGKDENARIRVEGVLRMKNMLIAVEIIALMAETLVQRLQMIISQSACSSDLIESVSSIIYASDRVAEIPELKDITQQFALKYTKEWCMTHRNNESNCVSPRIIKLLSSRPPALKLVIDELKGIAGEHDLDWTPQLDADADDVNALGSVMPLQSAEILPTAPAPAISAQDELAMAEKMYAHQDLTYPGCFRIIVHKTVNLRSQSSEAVQHPYVKMSLRGQQPIVTTVDHNGGLNPTWGQRMHDFKVMGPGQSLIVEVYNQSRNGDDFVGQSVLNIDDNLGSGRNASWWPLQREEPVGSILLSVQYIQVNQNQGQYNPHNPQMSQANHAHLNQQIMQMPQVPVPQNQMQHVSLVPEHKFPTQSFDQLPEVPAQPFNQPPSQPPAPAYMEPDSMQQQTDTPNNDDDMGMNFLDIPDIPNHKPGQGPGEKNNDDSDDAPKDDDEPGAADGPPDFDELERRFKALRG